MVDVPGRARADGPQDGTRALRRGHPDLDLRGDDGRRQGAADGDQPRAGAELRRGPSTSPSPTTSGTLEYVWQTSWGVSTRLIGALVMGHGDDFGLRLPPALAPAQVVVLVVKDSPEVRRGGRGAGRPSSRRPGHRVRLDDRTDTSFGRRSVDWELKGVPVRVEVGPRDLAEGNVTVVTRHRREKQNVAAGRRRRHGGRDPGRGRARAAGRGHGGPRRPDGGCRVAGRGRRGGRRSASPGSDWAALGPDGEDRLAEHAISVRCLQRPDGSLAEAGDAERRPRGRRGPGPY